MKRVTIAVIVGVALAAAAGVALDRFGHFRRVPEPGPAPGASAPVAAPAPSASAPEDPEPAHSEPADAQAGISDLPKDAPQRVRFGVILVQYQGAELAPGNAPGKASALERAKGLIPEATRNFEEAVKKGDKGSTSDAGSMPRGVLEPALEYALFTLKKGEVYGSPLDTARGFWIVRRIE